MTPNIPGLLNDEWRDPASARADALYSRANRHLARLMSQTHPFAIEYLEQCPALLVFASWGFSPKKVQHRMMIAERFGSAVKRGIKLKDMIVQFQGCYPARRLRGSVMHGRHFKTIMELRNFPPSDLAQAIPDGHQKQENWLRSMSTLLYYVSRSPMTRRAEIRLWGLRALSGALHEGMARPENQLHTVLDFLTRGDNALNPKWTLRGALAAAEEWHAALRRRHEAEAFTKQYGFAFDFEVDYGYLPDRLEIEGLEFVALKSAADLFAEGAAMRHCVGSYSPDVIRGATRIYSIRQHECRLATMELNPNKTGYRLDQIKAICNSTPSKTVIRTAEKFVEQVNEAAKARKPSVADRVEELTRQAIARGRGGLING